MSKVTLIKPFGKDGQQVNEIVLNLAEIKGNDLIKAEQLARMSGDMSPDPLMSTEGLSILAARVSGHVPEDIKNLYAPDFLAVTNTVKNFLYGWVLPESVRSQISENQS